MDLTVNKGRDKVDWLLRTHLKGRYVPEFSSFKLFQDGGGVTHVHLFSTTSPRQGDPHTGVVLERGEAEMQPSNAAKAAAIFCHTWGIVDERSAVKVYDRISADVHSVEATLLEKSAGVWEHVSHLSDTDLWAEIQTLALSIDRCFRKLAPPWEMKVAVVSTQHHPQGWEPADSDFVFLPREAADGVILCIEDVHSDLPEWQRELALPLVKAGYNFVRFDADGPVLDGLPVHPWS